MIVRRSTNPKEATLEAWGLVDGQPTSKHFSLLIYDDMVTLESVTSPEMINKVTAAWQTSLNLGADGGNRRMVGTRYHFNDSYKTILSQGSARPRVYTATADGTVTGEPVLMSRETLAEKRRDMGAYVFGCQMLQNPVADSAMGFKREWFATCPAEVNWHGMNRYILVDPASTKKTSGDYTAMWVIGLGQDQHYYVLDGVRDRLNLTQRADALLRLHRQYTPLSVGYESYGAQADIEHIQDRMGREGYHFAIVPLGGRIAKEDRIRRLVPLFQAGRVLFRQRIMVVDCEGRARDLCAEFLAEEYESFPVSIHDDMFDCLARILDPEIGAVFPAAMVAQEMRATQARARARAKDTFERDFYAL